jgi:UDP-N-acetylmuramate dehydrogenase
VEPGISDVRRIIMEIRRRKLPDPSITGNAGSFFINPVISPGDYANLARENPGMPSYRNGDEIKVPGAWLIEQCGWKGKRFGNAGVHMNQPLVLINYGSASGREILDLAEHIIASIKDRFGITLETEVNII